MADSGTLLPVLEDIQEKLKELRADIREAIGELQKIPVALQEGFKRVQEAIDENTQAQAELLLMEELADVQTIPPQIEAEEERIETEKQELEDKLDVIGDRFEQRQEELNEKAADRVRDLGEHIFEIMEEEYETNIEQPFVDHVTSTWHDMQLVTEGIAEDRSERLRQELDDTEAAIDEFMSRRKALLSDIDRHRAPVDIPIETAEPAQIPYWVVTVWDESERRQEVVVPIRITDGTDEWFTARAESLPGVEPIVRQVTEATDPALSVATQASADDLADALREYDRERMAGQLRFSDELAAAFADPVEISVEQEMSHQ